MKLSKSILTWSFFAWTVLSIVPTLADAITITGSSDFSGSPVYTYSDPDGFLRAGGNVSNLDTSVNQTTLPTQIMLASLLWHDKDDVKNVPDGVIVNWNVFIDITPPPATATNIAPNSLLLTLRKDQGNDTLDLDSLSGLSFSTTGWLINNFRYLLDNAALSGTQWTKQQKDNDSTLWIAADFTQIFIPPTSDPTPTPEPGTMMLLGAGFLGLAVYGKRRRNV